jgi:hypothetical protein
MSEGPVLTNLWLPILQFAALVVVFVCLHRMEKKKRELVDTANDLAELAQKMYRKEDADKIVKVMEDRIGQSVKIKSIIDG